MTKEELKEHCKRQIECCEMWARQCEEKPHGKIYEEHKLILDLIKELEQQPSDDCVSRQAVIDNIDSISEHHGGISDIRLVVTQLPPVTPTHCIAEVRFNKDDLKEICNERIEIECTHGTCKDCKRCCFITGTKNRVCEKHGCMQVSNNWYCADFEKQRNENDI